jgi:hypothetical protein
VLQTLVVAFRVVPPFTTLYSATTQHIPMCVCVWGGGLYSSHSKTNAMHRQIKIFSSINIHESSFSGSRVVIQRVPFKTQQYLQVLVCDVSITRRTK